MRSDSHPYAPRALYGLSIQTFPREGGLHPFLAIRAQPYRDACSGAPATSNCPKLKSDSPACSRAIFGPIVLRRHMSFAQTYGPAAWHCSLGTLTVSYDDVELADAGNVGMLRPCCLDPWK